MTTTVTIEIPLELIELCELDGSKPEEVIQMYINDLCGIAKNFTYNQTDEGKIKAEITHKLALKYYEEAYNLYYFVTDKNLQPD